ncbi:hypothetical protein FHR24_002835 [Wenyingzhuangia heitensis]|uniref:DUF1735 domain-containing protein n=1 Tax=Wenyingzhuangia heitensis TaxID=1487859 RepID=A0ABX0UBZ8_9FLAO|nr:hypothetical protein [Wenyingzhuangia heitensis]NIJ46348.1 hypothetical protein [Wenyingzhuangia heitensis]
MGIRYKLQIVTLLIACSTIWIGCDSDDRFKDSSTEEVLESLSITNFELLAKDNSSYTNIDLVVGSNLQSVDSLVICLFPISVDFTDLTPAITYLGSKIEYRINNDVFKEYSIKTGESIDFSFPNIVEFKVSNSESSLFKTYRIIVDTERPILFNNPNITIPDTEVKTSYNGLEIDTWKNVGNYPIRVTLRTTNYVDIKSPDNSTSTIFSTTLTNLTNVIPTSQGKVNVFTTNATVKGVYSTTALFHLYFNENLGYIVYDDITNKYVKDIGYIPVELSLKGTIVVP